MLFSMQKCHVWDTPSKNVHVKYLCEGWFCKHSREKMLWSNKTDDSLEMDGRRDTLPVYTVFQYTTLEQSHKMSKSGSNEKFPQFAIQIKTAKCIHSVVCHHSNGHGHPHDSLWCSKHSHSLKQTM